MSSINRNSRFYYFAIIILALLGIALIWYCTRWGAGMMDDSFMYINSAQNLVAGDGLRWLGGDGQLHPLTHFPPLFSLILAFLMWIGIEAIVAARVVNSLAFGVNLLLNGVLLERVTHSFWLVILGSILFIGSDVLIEAHAWAMSEPLFLSLYLGSVILMIRYLEKPQRRWIISAAILLGLSFLTRYVGMAFILTVMLTILAAPGIPKGRRWKDLLIFAAISLLFVVIWVAYTQFSIGSPTDRTFAFYSITSKQILRTFNTMLAWCIPGRLVNGYEIIWLVVILAGSIWLFMIHQKQNHTCKAISKSNARFSLYLFLALQFIGYIPVIFLSKSFFDPLTPLNNRILLPLLPISIVLLLQAGKILWKDGIITRRLFLSACCLVLVGMYGYRASLLVPRLHESGLGFTRKSMHNSPTLAALCDMPRKTLFSNSPYAITMWTGLPAYGIPALDVLRQRMADEEALLVVFDAVSLDLYDTNIHDLTQGLDMVAQFRDGAIYRLNSP